jgi:hypothetical protein
MIDHDNPRSKYCPKCGAGPWGNHLRGCPWEGKKPPFDWETATPWIKCPGQSIEKP